MVSYVFETIDEVSDPSPIVVHFVSKVENIKLYYDITNLDYFYRTISTIEKRP